MKILLAIDSSPASQAAVGEVAARPWPAGTTVDVLSAVEPPHAWTLSEQMAEVDRITQYLVQRAAKQLCGAGLAASPQVVTGDPKSAIVDYAAATGADLVVLGSHGAGGLTRFLLGSVARAVVRFAPCSVELVRASGETGGRGLKLLLATDGSPFSAAAARSIASRPWPSGSEVRIFTVVELALTDFQAAFEPPLFDTETKEKIREDAMRHAQEAIREAEEIFAGSDLNTSESICVLAGSPKQLILEEAKNWGADMIVTGCHGRRGVNRFMLGSVSDDVAAHAECSVEVIRG